MIIAQYYNFEKTWRIKAVKEFSTFRKLAGKYCTFERNGKTCKAKVGKVVWDDVCREMFCKIQTLNCNGVQMLPFPIYIPARKMNLCA